MKAPKVRPHISLARRARFNDTYPPSAVSACHKVRLILGSGIIHETNVPPKEAPTLHQTIRWNAQLGGFLGRKSDGNPGPTTLWRGLLRLQDIAEAYLVFNPPTCG